MCYTDNMTKYDKGIEFIALNDEPKERNIEVIKDMISVILLSVMFTKPEREVANDVLSFRITMDYISNDGSLDQRCS